MKGAPTTMVRLKVTAAARDLPDSAPPVSDSDGDVRRLVLEIDVTELRRALTDSARSAHAGAASDWVEAKTFQFGRRMFRRLAKKGAFPVATVGRQTIARRCDVYAYFESQLSSVPAGDARTMLVEPVRLAASNGRVARVTNATTAGDEQRSDAQLLQRRTHAEKKNRNGSVPRR
jgi:hypothetical protein